MKFHVDKPCKDCPFRKQGGIRLTRGRIMEIAASQLDRQGASFACHKTTGVMASTRLPRGLRDQYCAGALVFAEKHETVPQLVRIMERLGHYKRARLLPFYRLIWDTLDDWLDTAIDRERPIVAGRRRRRRA
jgi:hypothetical protein